MSTTVDNRVVEMQFDNHQFEKNVSTSLSTLDKLKKALNFDKSSKELNNFSAAAGKFNLNGISSAIDNVSQKFSAFGIIGITTLQRFTNEAITAGKQIVSALTIDPVKTGLEEYETKMGAIQVIRANDQAASMDDISSALNELNTYADKTIYNFAQMTSNVGKFVAQGLGVKEAANAVRGMANLAAASGASASDMARATYQMSQALGGVIRKIDVNSLRNANMWTTTLKDTLMDVARAEGVAIDKMIEEKGTLEETLEQGWLTGEMFTKAMNIYSGVYDDAQLRAMGFNDEQIKKFQQIAKTAEEAAVEIKTLSQLWDTLKENVQSGWTQTWELVIGNFEEAKQLWTDVSEVLSDFTNRMADRRNSILEGWKNLGGRDYFITGMWNALYSLIGLLDTVSSAFHSVFPEMTAKRLVEITKQFKEFTASLLLSDEGAVKLRTVFAGVFSVIHTGIQIFAAFVGGLRQLLSVFSPITDAVGRLILSFSRLFIAYDKSGEAGKKAKSAMQTIVDFIQKHFGKAIEKVAGYIDKISQMVSKKRLSISSGDGLFGSLGETITGLFGKLKGLSGAIDFVKGAFKSISSGVGPALVKVLNFLGGAFDSVFNSIVNAFKNADVNTALNILKTGLLAGLGFGLKNIIDKISSPVDVFKDLVGNISDVLGGVGDALGSFTENVKAGLILKIGVAIGILAASLLVLSGIQPEALGTGIAAITALFGELFGMLALMNKFLGDSKFKSATKIATLMIGLSAAVFILASALKKLSSVSVEDLGKGLLAITVLIAEMTGAAIALSKFGGKIKTSALGMVLFAASINILVSAVTKLGELHPETMAQGLKAVGILMAELVAFMIGAKFGKFGMSTGIAMIALAASLLILEKAVEKFGSLAWNTVTDGLLAIGGSLAILAAATHLMPKNLPIIAVGLILVGAALNIMSGAIQSFGAMSLPEIGKGLLVLGGSMLALAAGLNLMRGTLGGSAALLIAAGALTILTPVMERLGKLSLAEIGKSLLAIAGAFAILGVAGALLAPLLPVILGLSAAMLLISTAVGVAAAALTLFTVAITALATAGPLVVTAIASMIPIILSSIGEGFAAFISAIAENAVTITNGVKDILVAIVTAIGEAIPTIVLTAMQLLDSLLNTFLLYIPSLVSVGMQLILGILQGIAENIQAITEAAIEIMVNFIEGVASMLPDVIQAGFDLIIAFVNGLAEAIETNTQPLIDAVGRMFDAVIDAAVTIVSSSASKFLQAGKDAVGGLIDGIGSGVRSVGGAMANLGKKGLDGLSKAVGWNSPWESTYGAGVDGSKGLANGITDGSPAAEDAAGKAGRKTGLEYVEQFKKELSVLDKYGYSKIVGKYDPDNPGAKHVNSAIAFKNRKKQLDEETAATEELVEANDDLGKSYAKTNGKKTSGGGGGGSGAAKTATESKKLWDVLKDGDKVIQKHTEIFGELHEKLEYTTPFDMSKDAVQKLAEYIYEASLKTQSANDSAAKSTEDKLSAMREAFVNYQNKLKSTIEGQTDIWGKLELKSATTTKTWGKNLDKQTANLKEWERDLIKISTRVQTQTMEKILEMGPENLLQLKHILAMSEDELQKWESKLLGVSSVQSDAMEIGMAALAMNVAHQAQIADGMADTSEVIVKASEDLAETSQDTANKVSSSFNSMKESTNSFTGFTQQALSKAEASYIEMRDTIADVVNSQLDLFEKFRDEDEEAMDPEDLLDNMKSQVHGVEKWRSDMTTLLEKGLDEGLYKKLSEMGPKSYKYVEAFMEMTSTQLSEANSYFLQSLTLGEDTGQKMAADFAQAGLMASAGFASGINPAAGSEEIKKLAQNAVDTLRERIENPMSELGTALSNSLGAAMDANHDVTNVSAENLGSDAVKKIENVLTDQTTLDGIGYNLNAGLGQSIKDHGYIAVNAAGEVMTDVIDIMREIPVIESPSKVTQEFGKFIDMGLSLGLSNNANDVEASARSVGERAIDSMKAVVSHITDIINGEVSVDPTIRPVLDTSDLEAGMSSVDSMFSGRSYSLSRGMEIQNGSDSIRDLIAQTMASMNANALQPAYSGPPINMYVYGAQGQDEEELANIIESKLWHRINVKGGTWR